MKEAKRPAKEYNHDTGKMEDTNLPHWQEYYRKLDAFNAMIEAEKPQPYDYSDDTFYRKALEEWRMRKSINAPNKPGYYRANND